MFYQHKHLLALRMYSKQIALAIQTVKRIMD
nr:MAG TPA: hypothetical protein [Caudoviricetes sp.]